MPSFNLYELFAVVGVAAVTASAPTLEAHINVGTSIASLDSRFVAIGEEVYSFLSTQDVLADPIF